MVLDKKSNFSSMASAAADLACIIKYRNVTSKQTNASKFAPHGITNDKEYSNNKEQPLMAFDISDISTPPNMTR